MNWYDWVDMEMDVVDDWMKKMQMKRKKVWFLYIHLVGTDLKTGNMRFQTEFGSDCYSS